MLFRSAGQTACSLALGFGYAGVYNPHGEERLWQVQPMWPHSALLDTPCRYLLSYSYAHYNIAYPGIFSVICCVYVCRMRIRLEACGLTKIHQL